MNKIRILFKCFNENSTKRINLIYTYNKQVNLEPHYRASCRDIIISYKILLR